MNNEQITIVEISRRNHINTLSLSDGTTIRMSHSLFKESPWHQGTGVNSAAEILDWIKNNEKKYAMEKAGFLLSAKNRSEKELRDALIESAFSEPCVDAVIEKLLSVGYLNDETYAKSFIAQREARGYGKNKIRMELRQKGIAEEIILNLLEGDHGEDQQLASAMHLVEKAARGKNLKEYKDRQKVKAALVRRGFDFEMADEAIRLFLDGDKSLEDE